MNICLTLSRNHFPFNFRKNDLHGANVFTPPIQYSVNIQVEAYRKTSSVPFDILNRSKEVELVPCQNGWVYDNTTYTDSIVTEVH